MTSGNSSLVKFIKEQRALLWRRLPVAALSVLMYFLYDVFGTVMAVQRERAYGLSSPPYFLRGANAVSLLMGLRGAGWIIGCVGAVILGIQGFSFLFKSQTVDFYESRPEKRSVRFFNIVVNSILIYGIPSFLGCLLSFIIAFINGCGLRWLFAEIMVSWMLSTVLFLAVYAMSSFAALLTGTAVTAVLMNFFVFCIESFVRFLIWSHRAAYYATFDMDNSAGIMSGILSFPPVNYLKGIVESDIYLISEYDICFARVMEAALKCTAGTVRNLLLFLVFISAAFFLHEKRKAESAGKSVIYHPVELFIKYSSGVVFSLYAGLFTVWIFDNGSNIVSLPGVMISILISVFELCLIMESIFEQNVRSAFKRACDMPVIALICLIILFIYRTGVTGYDSWIPDENRVESAWLLNENYNLDYYDENNDYISTRKYVMKNMFLTDISDMRELSVIGQERMRNGGERKKTDGALEPEESWRAVVGWRMKDGRLITRIISIPEDIDPALMDRIVGSDEFLKGVYCMDSADSILEKGRKYSNRGQLSLAVSTEHGEVSGDGELIKGFLEKYVKDASEHYDFTMASNNNPVGSVSFRTEGMYDEYFSISWPLYDCYEETISYLRENGIWKGGFLEAPEIEKVEITGDSFREDGDYMSNVETVTDEERIEEILDASLPMNYSSAWIRYGNLEKEDDVSLSIAVYPRAEIRNDGSSDMFYDRRFFKGRAVY